MSGDPNSSNSRWFGGAIAILLALAWTGHAIGCPSTGDSSPCQCGANCKCCVVHAPPSTDLTPAPSALEPATGDVTIFMQNFTFSPEDVTVYVGATITWVNLDRDQHDTISDYGLWNSGYLNRNQTFSYTFDEGTDGVFTYYCSLHGGMNGSITVLVPEPTIVAPCLFAAIVVYRKRNKTHR